MVAINDAFLIESAIYKILKMRFSDKPYYVALLELMHEVRPPLVFPRRSFPPTSPTCFDPHLRAFRPVQC